MAHTQRKAIYLLIPLLLLVAVAAGGKSWLEEKLQPAHPGAASQMLTVPPGSSTRDVAELLQQQGLIKDAVVFRYYARYRQLDGKLQGGQYELSAAMTPEQILQKLARGEVVVRRFTVPEGLTVAEMADLLAEKKLVDREAFLKAAAASKLNAAYLPKDLQLAQPLEGYLFPATYDYKPGITPEEILAMMFAQWEHVFAPDLQAKAKALGMTVHEAMSLASIIEEEAQVAAERPVISGVYHNRLAIGMKLDADPTVAYAVGKPVGQPLLYADLEVESPYNTYRNAGLPPGPIAAPGKDSILAAVSPAKHDFWYFVAREDGSGQHFFASTLAEQDVNIEKARQNAAAKK
ncbi:MAG TPA: endolytic transglycosylase MltG [Symbiobacteriaceae bacterium]|nr:endolytic transglycosylase MltG [Symbiobacteriaceae bacterium]